MTGQEIQEELELSLSIKKGSFFKRPEFGHEFDKLKKELALDSTLQKAIKFAENATKWMVDLKHIDDLNVQGLITKANRLYLSISAVALTGDVVSFSRFVEVGDAS